MPFKGLLKKKRTFRIKPDNNGEQKQQKQQKRKHSEEHFEEISLDSRKRKNTAGTANSVPITTDKDGDTAESGSRRKSRHQIAGMSTRKFVCVIILFVINLLNYMDRFTVAGVLTDVQDFYGINDQMGGFLQTIFIIFFMLFAPVCGFLGDRCNRKWIIVAGEIIWVGAVLASSFVPKGHFTIFLLLRGVVGIGEASYAVISPTIIADMFAGKMRSRVLMFFYFAIPVGSGLGYVVGSSVTTLAKGSHAGNCDDCWQWGIRATPVIGLLSLIALIVGVQEPQRGQAESEISTAEERLTSPAEQQIYTTASANNNYGAILTAEEENLERRNSRNEWLRRHLATITGDLVYLVKNPTFVWSTVAYTAVVFVTGTLTWWSPAAIAEALAWHQNGTAAEATTDQKNSVALIFGGITCLGGFVGVTLGSLVAIAWKQGKWIFAGRATPQADPIISAIGSFGATPLLFLGIKMFDWDLIPVAWITLFFTIVCLCLNWAINVDMLMSIIVPHRRSIANALQIMVLHAFGDASSPWIVGMISDWIRGDSKTPESHFHSLMFAFYLPNVLLFVSGLAFLGAAYTLPGSLRQVEEWKRNRSTAAEATTATTAAPVIIAQNGAPHQLHRSTQQTAAAASTPSTNGNHQGFRNEAFE